MRKRSVFIDARKERDGPLITRRSFITKGPPTHLRDRPDRRSHFCPDVVKIYLVKNPVGFRREKWLLGFLKFKFIFFNKTFSFNYKNTFVKMFCHIKCEV